MGKKKIKGLALKNGNTFTIPNQESPIDYNARKPIFSFIYMQYGAKTCLSKHNDKTKSDIAEALIKLSQFPWNEIISKRYLGYERIPRRQFKNPIQLTVDVEKLVVFHFSYAGRMAGFQINDTYHIVQVSPTHELY